MEAIASMGSVSAAIDAIPAMKESLRKAFDDLEPFVSSLAGFSLRWDEIEAHFDSKFNSVKLRLDELADAVKSTNSCPPLIERKDETTMGADGVKSKTTLLTSIEKKDETTVKADEVKLTNSSPASVEKEEATVVTDSWQAPPKLKLICSNMDDCALTQYVIENDSDLLPFREKEIVLALRFAPDPVKLVLDFMDGFEPDEVDAAKDTEGSALLRGSFRLLVALAELKLHVSIPVKERAKAIATKWRKRVQKLHDDEGADRNAVAFAVQVYVKLVATYGLISDVGLEELTEIVQRGSQYRGMMKLCRQLGLSDRMPGVIERLSTKCDYLPAVEIAHLFGLCEKYPPVPLLNKYVQDVKRKYYSVMGKGDKKARVEAINKKLEAYRLLIVTIKKCNIDDFPVSPLKQKMTHLKGQREKELMAMISPRVEQKKPKQQQSPMMVPSSAAPIPSVPDLPVDKLLKEQNNSPGSSPMLTPQAHDSIIAGAAISALAAGTQPEVFEQNPVAGSSFRASHTMAASFDSYRLERYLPADRPTLMDKSSYDPYRAQHQDDPFNSRQDSFGRSLVAGSYWSPPRPSSGLSSDSRNVRLRTDAILGGELLYHPSDAFDNSRSRDNGSDSFSGTTASRYHSDFLLGYPFIPPSS